MCFELGRRALALILAVGKDNDLVGEDFAFVQEVGGEDDGALGALGEDNVPDGSARYRVL